MKTNLQKTHSLVFAASLASGMLLTGVAASAQAAATTAPPSTANATNASMLVSTVGAKARRQAELERENAEERRIEFVHFGMSF